MLCHLCYICDMGNASNIEQYQFTSAQDRQAAAENGRKGGIASGIAKREKRRLSRALSAVLDESVALTDGSQMTRGEIIVRNILSRAKDEGTVRDLKTLMELTGDYTPSLDLDTTPVVILRPSELEAIDKLKK